MPTHCLPHIITRIFFCFLKKFFTIIREKFIDLHLIIFKKKCVHVFPLAYSHAASYLLIFLVLLAVFWLIIYVRKKNLIVPLNFFYFYFFYCVAGKKERFIFFLGGWQIKCAVDIKKFFSIFWSIEWRVSWGWKIIKCKENIFIQRVIIILKEMQLWYFITTKKKCDLKLYIKKETQKYSQDEAINNLFTYYWINLLHWKWRWKQGIKIV